LVKLVVEDGWSLRRAARAKGVAPKTVARWVARYRAEGSNGLLDRSSRPHHSPRRLARATARRIVRLRQKDRLTMAEIARREKTSVATVQRVLAAKDLNHLSQLEPKPPVQRYEHDHPGSLVHLDIKKLGRFRVPGHRVTRTRRKDSRGMGWEYVHVAVDDHSRVAYVQIGPDERASTAWRMLISAIRYYRSLGVRVERILTDNGSCYRSRAFKRCCRRLGIKHRRTRPYSPQTNGKAERFIQTALREWAYAHKYMNSERRAAELPNWLHRYNWHRRHGGIAGQTPISRLGLTGDNLLRLHN
jgi:transposase InsO family protein